MNIRIRALYFLVVLLSIHHWAVAESIGSEITYKPSATPGVYEVTLIIYRSCDNIALCGGSCSAPCTQTLSLMGGDSGYTSTTYGNFTVTLQQVRDIGNNTQYCASAKNTCNNRGCETPGTFSVGFERYEFRGFVNIGSASGIPANCCNVRFVYNTSCCRAGIQTIPASSSDPIYQEAVINRCLSAGINNSSPVFTKDPLYVTCGSEHVIFNNGLVDPDGDSLSVVFAPALKAYKTPITYAAPFSYNYPIPWTGNVYSEFPGGIRCDPFNGDVSFTPANASSQHFTGLLTFTCEQWRMIGGVYKLLGTVRRECALTVLANCASNNSPHLQTNPPSASNPYAPKTYWEVLEGKQLCFTVTAKDTDLYLPTQSDTTVLTWNQSLANLGATFLPVYSGTRSVSGPREDTYQFCWTPQEGLASSLPYSFVVSAADQRCPSNGKISRAFSVNVLALPKPFLTQKTVTCNSVSLRFALLNSLAPGIGLAWVVSTDTQTLSLSQVVSYPATAGVAISHSFSKPGTYYVRLYALRSEGGSYPVLVDSVVINPFNLKDSLAVTSPACYGSSSGTLVAIGKNGTPPYAYAINSDTAFRLSGSFTGLPAAVYRVTLKDSVGCVATDTIVLPQPSQLQSVLRYSQHTCDTFGVLQVAASGGTAGYTYRFNEGPLQLQSSLPVYTSGTYRVVVTDSNQCMRADSLAIALPKPLHQTVHFTKQACDSFGTIHVQATGGKIPYRYRLNNDPIQSGSSFPVYTSGTYTLSVTDSALCVQQDSIVVTLPEPFYYAFIKKEISCFLGLDGGITFQARGGNASGGYRYAIVNTSIQNTTGIFGNLNAGVYVFSIRDDSNCTLLHTEQWNNPPELTVSPLSGDSVVALRSTHAYSVVPQPGRTYSWQVTKGTVVAGTGTPSVLVRWDSVGIGNVSVMVVDSNRCLVTSGMNITIGSTGIASVARESGVALFPNPTRHSLTVSLHTLPDNSTLSLYDLQGKLLLQQTLKLTQELNLQELPQGMYVLKVGDWYGKVVKD